MSTKGTKKLLKMIYDAAYRRIEETDNILSDQFLKAIFVKYPKEFKIPIIFRILEQANCEYLYIMINGISNRSLRSEYHKMSDIIKGRSSKQTSETKQDFSYRNLNEIFRGFDYRKTITRLMDIDRKLYNKYVSFSCSEGFDVDFIIKEVKNNLKGITNVSPLRQFSKKFELDECPICTAKKFKYVWLSCGHNICYHCFKVLQKHSRHNEIKCPYCCAVTKF